MLNLCKYIITSALLVLCQGAARSEVVKPLPVSDIYYRGENSGILVHAKNSVSFVDHSPNSSWTKKMIIPFTKINDFIVVEVRFNGIPSKFIFDTGSESTIITNKPLLDITNPNYMRKIPIFGSDVSRPLNAQLAKSIRLDLAGGHQMLRDILVLEEDYLDLSSMIGENISGILGSDIFRFKTLTVDNKKNRIIITSDNILKSPGKDYTAYKIELKKGKPYLKVPISLDQSNPPVLLNLLMDTGAATTLLLNAGSHKSLTLPPYAIPCPVGNGLGGPLNGFVSTVESFQFGTTNFQSLQSYFISMDSTYLEEQNHSTRRNGILGNSILSNYSYIIDSKNEIAYFKPLSKRKIVQTVDKSGLILFSGGRNHKDLYIHSVLISSPALKSDLRAGDKILNFNGDDANELTLGYIQKKLRGKVNSSIKIKVERNGEVLIKTLVLQNYLSKFANLEPPTMFVSK
jgi:hypothetical protein